jgi:hypothetical protein
MSLEAFRVRSFQQKVLGGAAVLKKALLLHLHTLH